MTLPVIDAERETGFTAGPWKVMDDENCVGTSAADIADVGSWWPLADHLEREANARLIAAAPDLYAALDDLTRNIGAASLVRNPLGIEIRAKAEAALTKARTGAPE